MKNGVLGLVCALVFLLLLGATEKSCDNGPPPYDLNMAIADLYNPGKIVRRQAAENIALLIEDPGIQRAIKPLAEVLLNKGIPSGIFTQEICAENLGRIAAHLGGPEAKRAISALAESLANEWYDSIRAGSARALGLSLSAAAVEPLQNALANDPSPLVQAAAQEALYKLSRNGVNIFSGSLKSSNLDSGSASTAVGQMELYQYLKSQVIYSNPPLDPQGGGL